MTDVEDAAAAIIQPGHGRQLQAGPTRPTVKVGPHNGSRLIGMLESELPPGGGFPGHVHEEYEEVFYVLAGEVEYLIDGTWFSVPRGSTVFVPPGTVHGFRNRSGEPARHLAIASPAEAMTMIEELTQAAPERHGGVLARHRSRLAD
jgi:quercetin dioxygenase-like cupin family protein